MVEIRTSIWVLLTLTLKRPSCGKRFSEMSRPDMSFSRRTSAEAIFGSASACTCNIPSIRKRMSTLCS